MTTQTDHKSYHVLIVDDEQEQAELVKEFLELSGNFQIKWANSISSLWEYLQENSFDMILLDYRLPDGTGMKVLEDFREREIKTPTVLITGQGDERLAARAIQMGAVDYLVKGTNYLSTLPALIQKAIRSNELQHSINRSMEQIRYQALLLNNVRDAIVVWDTDGTIQHWNFAASVLFGFSPKERVGRSIEDCYLNEFDPPVFIQPGEGTGGQEIGRRYTHPDGRTIWVSSRVNALRDYGTQNQLIGYMDVTRDITSRKQAEEALRTERNFVSAILNTVGALVLVLDSSGRIVRFNRAFEEISGYRLNEMRGKPFVQTFIVSEEAPHVTQAYRELILGKQQNQWESHLQAQNGSLHLISWTNAVIVDSQGNTDYVIATGIDITERHRAESALRASEERYRTVSELVSDFVYALSLEDSGNFHFEWATDSLTRLVGLDLQEPNLEREWQRFIHKDDIPTIYKMAAEMHAGRSHVCEFRLINKDGREIWLQNYARPIADHNHTGRVRIFGASKNITEQKLMEKQIQDAQVRLANSARLAAIGELASGVAHHINNPLTTIIAETQLLLHNLSEDSAERESAEAIEHAGWRVQKAVQQLLEFSRPTGSSLQAVCVNKTIEAALSLIGDHIISSGITLKIDLAEELPHLNGNERQLNDLWTNLLLLARDATSDGEPHQIIIRSQCISPDEVLIEIGDDGKLIPEEEMQTLFEPDFIRPVGGRGTGIELNICQEIVRQHKGEITAVSNSDEGTVFRVSFPVEV